MRVTLIILDSLGVGELPDAKQYGDSGSNTLLHIIQKENPHLPNLSKLGLLDTINLTKTPCATVAKATELSVGKDTLTGHLEICGVVSNLPYKTYPSGFPKDVVDRLEKAFGCGILGNVVGSGTDLIALYGLEHVKTGKPIIYTSQDSVLQIAVHTDVIPLERLYEFCQKAREIMQGENKVGRVIARPFVGTNPSNFVRTKYRRDYALTPPKTLLDELKNAGKDVIAIGKITDIFAGQGITKSVASKSNLEGIEAIKQELKQDFDGLLFANLVDFDMLFGHRNDVAGYAKALEEFDSHLPKILELIGKGDLLIISADHGCDPTTSSTDHSREYVPVLFYGQGISGDNFGTIDMSDIGATIAKFLGVEYGLSGKSVF